MTTYTPPRRRPARAPEPWTPADDAALSAVLDEATRPEPRPSVILPLPTLPPGYKVRLDGTVATLTTPSGAACAFDGRIVSGGRTVAGPDADRARVAAHEEARRLAARSAEPPRAWARPVHADDAK